MTTPLLLLAALLAQPAFARPPQAGEEWEISRVSETRFTTSIASEGHSYDRDVLIERVMAVREDSVELEYDLPTDTPAEERAAVWQFPARILKRHGQPPQLLNEAELEARVERWLTAAGWTRERCGQWIFTWTAIRIDCDPASALAMIAEVDINAQELRDGGAYSDPNAAAPVTLRLGEPRLHVASFIANLPVDPEIVRRDLVRQDEVVAQFSPDTPDGRAVTAAMATRNVSGTINVRFTVNSETGSLQRRRIIRLEIERANGDRETRTTTETIDRVPIASPLR